MFIAICALHPAMSRADSVISLHATVMNGGTRGSTFYIAPGVAVTNAHVVTGLRPGDAVMLRAATGRQAEARLIAVSERMDLAILRGPEDFLPPAPARDATPRAGAAITAAGLLIRPTTAQVTSVAIDGAVSDPAITIPRFGAGLLAAAPGVGPGFSGGPVIDADGRLVGMIAAVRGGGGRLRPAAGSAFAPLRGAGSGVDAFVLRAAEVRAEALRLLRGSGG